MAALEALLDKYGKRTIAIPGGSAGGSADASGGIGKTWVPPLGGASVIVPGVVAEPGYADRLAEAGYRPQRVREGYVDPLWRELFDRSRIVLVALVVALALAAWASRKID